MPWQRPPFPPLVDRRWFGDHPHSTDLFALTAQLTDLVEPGSPPSDIRWSRRRALSESRQLVSFISPRVVLTCLEHPGPVPKLAEQGRELASRKQSDHRLTGCDR